MLRKESFKGRTDSISGFFHDIFTVVAHPLLALRAMCGTSLSATFRQRLMLSVIGVNGCRYGTYLHTREALHAGLSKQEINYLLGGMMENVLLNEAKAILYAQHWARNNAKPDLQVQADFIESYGVETSRVIAMALELIGIGNLTGNSVDYLFL